MSDILKRYIREILTEEVVTVSKGTESDVYDVQFDKAGNIRSGKKVDISEEQEDLLKKASRVSAAPMGALLSKLNDPNIPIQQKAKNPIQMSKILNNYWADTLEWPVPSRIGRGELALTMAFKRSSSIKEPDFVSEDGNLKISVKFAGDGGKDTILTGGSDQRVADVTQELSNLLKIKFPQGGSWSATQMRQILSETNPRARAALIAKIRKVLEKMKAVILTEHGALGIMMIDLARGFYFVNDPSQIQPSAIRFGGTRVEFKGPYGSGSTLESALDEFS